MAIDTPLKRQASSRFGMPWSAGTRIPSGTSTAFERAATLGLYHISYTVADKPADGWTFGRDERIWTWSH